MAVERGADHGGCKCRPCIQEAGIGKAGRVAAEIDSCREVKERIEHHRRQEEGSEQEDSSRISPSRHKRRRRNREQQY